MRPIERGAAPRNYTNYKDAIHDLKKRLGSYCSYCERRLPVAPAVEHMSPKSLHPTQELDWDNFLIGCTNCNSTKGDKNVANKDVLWPDRHNTILVLEYSRGGYVGTAAGLDSELGRRTRGLIDLVGLNRHIADGYPAPTKKDERWVQREEIWAEAEQCCLLFEALHRSESALKLVIKVAKGYGFFSVWLSVFARYPEVKRALIESFAGTARSCFNEYGEAVKRPNSAI